MKSHRPFMLQEYDPAWKNRFTTIARRVAPLLGDNLVEVEHIGSTSIEGMFAKPQIDVLVVVKNIDAVARVRGDFEKNGFISQGRGYVADDDEYFTEDGPEGKRLASVHILQEGNPKIRDYKVFRDYLKQHEADRNLYIETKRKLYKSYADSYAQYDGGKKDVIEAIRGRAREWGITTN
jgi:GrpB-like predicted nucleotidyltransferase (UPF0157 family)